MRDNRTSRESRAAQAARLGVAVVTSVLVIASAPVNPAMASGERSAPRSHVPATGHDRLAARTVAERKRLLRALRRAPRRVFSGSFLRRAAITGMRVPVTARLRAGTRLGITWAPTRFPLPGARYEAPTGEQLVELSGSFPMVIDFASGPGYGGPGNLQARVLAAGSIRGLGPLDVADLAGCTAVPPPFIEAASTSGGTPLLAAPASPTWVDMNPFTGVSDGYLDLKLSLRTRVISALETCPSTAVGVDYDPPATTDPADPWNTPVRVRWDGSFRIAPGIMPDGAIRLGKIVANAAVQDQSPTTGSIWGCAPTDALTGAGLPIAGASCAPSGPGSLAEAVGPAPFPATFAVKEFQADILLGDVGA